MSECLLIVSCQDQFHDVKIYSEEELSTRIVLTAENTSTLTPPASRHLNSAWFPADI